MKIKIVFFDCDGVLLFGGPLTKLETFLNIPSAVVKQWIDDYYEDKITFDFWIKKLEILYIEAGLQEKDAKRIMDIKNYSINDEAGELMGYLKDKGYEIAIISSGSDIYVSQVAENFDIKYFRVNTSLLFDDSGKLREFKTFGPDQDVKADQIKEICRELGVDPTETIFIGDSFNDQKAFGLTKHGILYRTQNPLLEKIAWKRVDDLRQIIDILENTEAN